MRTLTIALCLTLTASTCVVAQEVNDAAASLTSHGADPGFLPFYTSAQGSMALEVGGASNSLFALLLGQRAATSLCPPILNGECLELEMGLASIPLTVLFDGFAGSLFGRLDSSGEADFAFPATLFNNQSPAFQALVQDATNPPINISFSAACDFEVSNASVFQGDDSFIEYFFPSGGPYHLYGESFTSITVSTNGWIKFGGGCNFSDLSESTADLFAGTIGGAPGGDAIVAALWDDLDMGNSASQQVRIQESQTSSGPQISVRWINADLFPSTPIGSIEVTIKSTGTIEIDHTNLTSTLTGIVGISSGENSGGTTISSHDFYNAGSAPNSFSSFSFKNTIYRNYNSFPDTPSPLYTLCFQPQNAFGAYNMNGVIIVQACL
ncbi:MAG: hypothetical protein KDB53_07910 [Planctomycetes bacterium]|nr:hypothetical protein [Planctomycetota bacterium]